MISFLCRLRAASSARLFDTLKSSAHAELFYVLRVPGFPPPGPVPHFRVKNLSLRGRNAPVAIRNPCEDAFPTEFYR